ncbi:hypothetical protein H6P81_014020 [Aristolochia fimbriata]|uniref:Uncharacterized protein n=1 Tax=Aristolochia fimbriata TaxID=158543 RepID=A0AAV7EGD4_ARIFI|nr:hypothetical protein H6P81_014020 [Aristolochia fimbriata]
MSSPGGFASTVRIRERSMPTRESRPWSCVSSFWRSGERGPASLPASVGAAAWTLANFSKLGDTSSIF